MNEQIDIGDGRTLSLTVFSRQSGLCGDAHIWAGDQSSVLTGSGFFSTAATLRRILMDRGIEVLFVTCCDDKRQIVFEKFLERAGAQRVKEMDIEGDEVEAWKIL